MELISINRYFYNNPNFRSNQDVCINNKELEAVYGRYLASLKPYSTDLQREGISLEVIARKEVERSSKEAISRMIAFCENTDLPFPTVVGFAIVGFYPNAYGYSDNYLQEFYVDRPGEGIGKEALYTLLDYMPGNREDLSLYVLEKNTPAIGFFNHVMEQKGYTDLARKKIILPPPEAFEEAKNDKYEFQFWRKNISIF